MAPAARGLYWQVVALKQRGFSLREVLERMLKGETIFRYAFQPSCQITDMAVSDLDVWRAARLLLEQQRGVAGLVAAQRADELLEAGDPAGSFVWKRIAAAIEEWQREGPNTDERLN